MAKILVVDDNPTNRDFLVTLLRYGGHELSEASDGAEAAASVELTRPDLVISDILMPVADGYEFVRRIRSNPELSATPVIFYTAAYHRREAEPLTTAATGVQYLAKPSEPSVILLMVDAALKGHARPPAAAPELDVEYDREHLRLLTDKLAHKVAELEREIAQRNAAEAERDELAAERATRHEAERAARLEAERQGRIKDEFLATLSHELRTPLNAIVGWAQILQTTRDEADWREGIEVISRNARVQQSIIEDLLDMSRIISGKIRLDVERAEVSKIVLASIETVRHAADAKGISLQTVIEAGTDSVTGDAGRLQQVFWNLLTNAIKFTPRGGRVQVTVGRADGHVSVAVVDTGEGITPEFLPLVFDRFRQADGSTTRRHGGLGLGLSIVKQLVELHGGTVRAASAGQGQGATFAVDLPAAASPATRPRQDAIQPPTPYPHLRRPDASAGRTLAGVTVLMIDDESDARGLVRRLLADSEAVVIAAASAAEGLSLVQARRPHVVVSDIGMPVEDGYAFIGQLRALDEDRGGRTPAVALTAYAHSEDRSRAIAAGYQAHLSKPVDGGELISTIERLTTCVETVRLP